MKKMGRPTDDLKEKILPVRLSEKDIEKLEYCSNVSGKSKAEVLRFGLNEIYKKLKENT